MEITCTKRVCKGFEIKNLWEYHDLYVQSDTLLLGDVFENFRKMWLKIYELDTTLLILEKGLEKENFTLFINMETLITNTWKIMIKIKSRHILNIGM